jgi:sec-independent protein translocase protein TatC
MSLIEHLTELRRRLIISVVAVGVGFVIAFALYGPILSLLTEPYKAATHSQKLQALDPLEGFATRLKLATYVGIAIASPVILWQFWRFISPGLHKREKRFAIPFVVASVMLFVMGAAVALLTFEPALKFLSAVGGSEVANVYTPTKYINFILLMIAAFGLSFEFPILLVFMELAGILPSAKLRKWRRGAIVTIVIVAAVITPSQDPISLFAMAIPMYIFYEAAILVGRWLKK